MGCISVKLRTVDDPESFWQNQFFIDRFLISYSFSRTLTIPKEYDLDDYMAAIHDVAIEATLAEDISFLLEKLKGKHKMPGWSIDSCLSNLKKDYYKPNLIKIK